MTKSYISASLLFFISKSILANGQEVISIKTTHLNQSEITSKSVFNTSPFEENTWDNLGLIDCDREAVFGFGNTYEDSVFTGCGRGFAIDSLGNLYAGGKFTSVNGVNANGIAKWSNNKWSALGAGLNTNVSALVVDAVGTLYSGGPEMKLNGKVLTNVSKWDGKQWSTLGSGFSNPKLEDGHRHSIGALALDAAGNLYAGGNYSKSGDFNINCIAKWNGKIWSSLDTGMSGRFAKTYPERIKIGSIYINTISSIVIDTSGNLYAGGNFIKAGNVTVNGIAKWNGTSWSALGTGVDNVVRALALDYEGNLYAGGFFTRAGEIETPKGIAKWNGTSWSALGADQSPSAPYSLAVDRVGNLYAGYTTGYTAAYNGTGISKWNGKVWTAVGKPWACLGKPWVEFDVNSGIACHVDALVLDKEKNLYARVIVSKNTRQVRTFIAKTKLTENPPLSFALWVSSQFSNEEQTKEAISGPEADPDGDGLSNLLEFVLGKKPKNQDGSPYLPIKTRKSQSSGISQTVLYVTHAIDSSDAKWQEPKTDSPNGVSLRHATSFADVIIKFQYASTPNATVWTDLADGANGVSITDSGRQFEVKMPISKNPTFFRMVATQN